MGRMTAITPSANDYNDDNTISVTVFTLNVQHAPKPIYHVPIPDKQNVVDPH
jgi:hypothetical protein